MSDTDPALMTAETLLGLYARRALSPVEALQAVTERVARLNPWVNAFACMNPRSHIAAGESAQRWAAGRPIGLLDGVPTTVKDLVNMAGLPTRRGSRTTDATPATEDAPLVMGLKAEGAVIIGKTTTTEFGWKTPGDCPLHGITRNPWNRDRTPGGSSAGAGAAGAASFGPLHLGTDAGGSIRIPAAWCGLVGVKPSFGRIPQWPHGAFSGVACAGPMTRTVRDAALMMSAMARFDARDPYALPDDRRDWRDGIEQGVAGLRVALVRNLGFAAPLDAEGEDALVAAARMLEAQGAIVEEADPGLPDTSAIFGRVWGVALSRLVASTPPEKRALLDAGIEEVARRQDDMPATDFLGAEMLRIEAAHIMARFHQRYDLILTASTPTAAIGADQPTIRAWEALWRDWAPWTFAFNLTRQPAITVPVGLDEAGMPRGVQVAAALYRDDLAFRAARAIEVAASVATAAPV
ncbi:aspartyl-tRNA(Asn)/glutamyl-tRNA(Gln) amidotransferase subunit A [Humitalea rosea]|uniref:Aspartyl-tRNA(Asn)/glutamyl-tRNA(Gln) amidotransferase subunit A n=1 Tax=Humitalea rosea TaxID=990373 RepID=A0A2W7IPI7_9PROT|nr:amidase [Humitalea rosea]PZW48004.1 aspartyl-tRNA(Asn)/glutamyl-tRNA(Gln) amidotransferase subunit A [Humitalea rosea]